MDYLTSNSYGRPPGTYWINGQQNPPQGAGFQDWYKWTTNSSKPCSTCEALNGTIHPHYQSKPHPGCECSQTKLWFTGGFCTHYERELISAETMYEIVGVGVVFGNSTKSWRNDQGTTESSNHGIGYGGISLGSSSGTSVVTGEVTSLHNDSDEAKRVFASWEITEEKYIDKYDCVTYNPQLPVFKVIIELIDFGFAD